jgi:hypothetical protein
MQFSRSCEWTEQRALLEDRLRNVRIAYSMLHYSHFNSNSTIAGNSE